MLCSLLRFSPLFLQPVYTMMGQGTLPGLLQLLLLVPLLPVRDGLLHRWGPCYQKSSPHASREGCKVGMAYLAWSGLPWDGMG